MPGLDTTANDHGYLLGRLFATVEALELAATGKGADGLTFGKFAVCVANPRITLRVVEQFTPMWMRRLRNSDPNRADEYTAAIADLTDRASAAAPSTDLTGDQSLFILGYHHQRVGETVTTDQVAALIGVGSRAAARVQLRRWNLEPARVDPKTGEKSWSRRDVMRAHRSRPGQGVGGGRPRKPAS